MVNTTEGTYASKVNCKTALEVTNLFHFESVNFHWKNIF